MRAKRDFKNDLSSLKRQNLNLLREREILRDEVRILTAEREDRCRKLTELWVTLTDIKRLVEMVREVPLAKESGKDWDSLVDAVEALCNDFVRIDNSERKLNDRISDIRRELMAEKAKTIWDRIVSRFRSGG
jgi:predicted nuclease with TOPRIM domain